MSTKPLELTVKAAILEALEAENFDVSRAARALQVGESTIYRKLRRWNLMPPMFSPSPGGKVLRKDFMDRCHSIHEALLQAKG